jgi:hypothetical protein
MGITVLFHLSAQFFGKSVYVLRWLMVMLNSSDNPSLRSQKLVNVLLGWHGSYFGRLTATT